MKIVKDPEKNPSDLNGASKIEIAELKEMTKKMSEDLVKAVVDIEKKIVAVDAPLHADLEEFLIREENSEPQNLWGINIWPDLEGDKLIEFDSMINIKPGWGNKTRGVGDFKIREKIKSIVNNSIKK